MTLLSISDAICAIQSGKVVALPTDTVFGIAAMIQHSDSVRDLFTLKKRPHNKPLIILCSAFSQISSFISLFPPGFEELRNTFWPGGLTIVLPIIEKSIPDSICLGLPTCGFRIPNHPILLHILDKVGPLAVTSANLSGMPSATTAKEILTYFGNDFPVLDDSSAVKGIESTIVTYHENGWKILRDGAISKELLKKVVSISDF